MSKPDEAVAAASRRRRRKRAGVLAAMAMVAIAVAIAADLSGLLDRAEQRSYDLRLQVRGPVAPPPDVVVVAIDERTIDHLDRRYPFARSLHARAIRRLTAAGPDLIAYNVVFADPTTRAEDRALVGALAAAARRAPVLLAVAKVREDSGAPVLFFARRLENLGLEVGEAIVSADSDGSFRKADYGLAGLPAFGVRAAELAAGRPAPTPSPGEPAWIDYRGPPGTYPTLSFLDVLRGRFDPARLRGRIVLVGITDPTIAGLVAVPPSGELMSGVEMQANVMETARAGYPLRDAGGWTGLVLVVGLGLLAPALALAVPDLLRPRGGRLGSLWASYLAVVLLWALGLAGFLVAAQLLFEAGAVVVVAAPLLAAVLALAGALVADTGAAFRSRRRLRNAFASYVDPRLVERALLHADSNGELPGRELQVSILFCDLRDWTTFVDAALPADDPEAAVRIVEILDCYLVDVATIVAANQGAVFCFEGDGMMSVFGGVDADLDHAEHALNAARSLVAEIPWRLGVGIASGPVVSGTVGKGSRLAFTVSGKAVNLAARLQGETKEEGWPILLSEQTHDGLPPWLRKGVSGPRVMQIRGFEEPQRVWSAGSREEWLGTQTIKEANEVSGPVSWRFAR